MLSHLDGIWYVIMTLSSALAISSHSGSCRTYLMKCSPSCEETLACDWPPSEPPSRLLVLALGSCSRESTLPKYLLVLLLPESERRSQKWTRACEMLQEETININFY